MSQNATHDTADTMQAGQSPDRVEWRFDIPLLASRFMLWDFLRVTLISVAIMYVLVAFTGWVVDGEVVILPPFVFALTTAIMLALFAIASLLLGNRHGARFGVTPTGVTYAAEERERRINRVVAVAGALAGNPTTTGAGLLATSQESLAVPWTDIDRVVYYPGPRVIVIRNSWRAVLRLHCTAEVYPLAASLCDTYWRAAAPKREKAKVHVPRRGPWFYHVGLFVSAAMAGVGAQVWYWNDYELAARMGGLGAVLVALSMLFVGVPRRIFSVLALPLLVWHVGAIVLSALSSVGDAFGRSFVGSFDPGELTLTAVSLAVLLGMAVWRAFGPEASDG